MPAACGSPHRGDPRPRCVAVVHALEKHSSLRRTALGWSLAGAGGGGFLIVLLKQAGHEGVASLQRAVQACAAESDELLGVRVVPAALDWRGLSTSSGREAAPPLNG